MSGYERENRNVLRRCLKTASDGAAVTWAGRSFHTVVPEAKNVRLPTVDQRMIISVISKIVTRDEKSNSRPLWFFTFLVQLAELIV